jgi:uncharacterized protein (DUF697 family)
MTEEIVKEEAKAEEMLPTREEADRLIRNHVYGAMGVGLIPLPIVDFVALTGVQLNMLRRLAKLYEVPFSQDKVKNLLSCLVGGAVPVGAAAPMASLLKAIPIVGQTVGVLGTSLAGGAVTYAVGKVFLQHFASGGTFLNFNPDEVKEYYAKMFQEGKLVVSQIKEGAAAA